MGSLVILLSVLSIAGIVIGVACVIISMMMKNEQLELFGSRVLIAGGIGLFLSFLLAFTLCSTR